MKEFNGITPEMQHEWLNRHAHLEGVTKSNGITTKYFTMKDEGFRVIIYNDIAVQIIKHRAKEIKSMVACANLKFGGF